METEQIGVQGVSYVFEVSAFKRKDVLKGNGWGNEGEKKNWTNLYVLLDTDGWGADYARNGACLV